MLTVFLMRKLCFISQQYEIRSGCADGYNIIFFFLFIITNSVYEVSGTFVNCKSLDLSSYWLIFACHGLRKPRRCVYFFIFFSHKETDGVKLRTNIWRALNKYLAIIFRCYLFLPENKVAVKTCEHFKNFPI